MFCTSNLSVLCEIFCIHVEGGKGSSATECIDVFLKYLPTCDFPLGRSSLTGSELSSMLEGDDRFVMTWLETHDSMVLATKNGISSTYSLEFIYLDGWKNFVTSDISHGRRNTTISGNWNTLFLGQVPSDEDFSNKFFSATRLSDKVYKDTSALVSDLIKKLSNAFYLKLPDDKLDGLTTSRMPNKISTSWSLLKAAINIMIDQRLSGDVNHLRGEFLFERLEAGFYVWVLENILVTSPVKAEIIDTLMSAHRTASERCADLAEKNFDMSVVATRLETLSAKWERLAAKTTLAISTLLVDDANTTAWSHPVIVLPTETSQPLHSDPNIADVRRNIEANLGALRPFPAFPALPGHVLNWINSTAALPNHLQPMIRSVEHWFLEGALSLKVNSDKGYVCEDIYIADVESIMKLYRDSSAKFQLMAKKSKLPQPELKSLEILCVWIAFCMVHAAAVKRYPLLNHYDVALNGADLHHLVLSEKVAVDATLAVVSYLKKFSKSLPVIFSLSYQDGTMQFAKEYSSADVTMIRMYIKELEDAESKRNANYKIVLGKQKLAKTIRGEIVDAEQKIIKSELELLRSDGRERYYSNIIARYRRDIDNLKSRLGNALKSPPMVYQSLPRDKSGAMVNLFFIYMPKSLRTVFTLTALAKQILVPRSSLSGSITGSELKDALTTSMSVKLSSNVSLWTYYKTNSSSQTEVEPNNLLFRYQGKISDQLPGDVDSYQDSSSGTYHPDNLIPIISWTGGDYARDQLISGDYNPFNCQSNPIIKMAQNLYFTEELPPRASNLQWALLIGEDRTAPDATRGNKGPAELNKKPDWLNKPQFLAYSSMRSYQHMQLRNLVAALKADSLPLDCPEVLTLFEQTLYQIGRITNQLEPELSWKRDAPELFLLMEQELRRLAEQLQESPKSHMALHLLSTIAVFVGQHLATCRELTRNVSTIALRWTKEIEQEIEAMNADSRYIYKQRAKQFIFYSYSLLCYRFSELTTGDAERIVRLVVLARNVRVFKDETSYEEDIEAFHIAVERAMSGLAAKLHVVLTGTDFSLVFTSAVGVVISSLPALQWTVVPKSLCCFEATDSSGLGSLPRLLSFNAVSGVVLCDGMPPRRLPKSVTSNEMYVRSFGIRDFEVTMSADVYTSSRPLDGCIYQFTPPRNGAELIVTEKHVDDGVELQLLQGGVSGEWKENLPIRLHELHSHWYCESHNLIILRSISFLERDISYLITGNFFSPFDEKCHCFIIPPNYQHQPISIILQLINKEPQHFRRLILHSPHLVTVIMTRIEDIDFIHTQLTHEESIIVHLPRFDLSFSVGSDGVVRSEDYEGYQLAKTQHLEGTLRGFTGYLVLHNSNDDVRVVIPVGQVMFNKLLDRTHIELDKECGTERRCHVYSFNPRLHILQGSDIAAQLHLAALYAATATALPEPLTGRTGDETAIRIMRENFVNKPLTSEENIHLRNVTHFCNRSPALILLCHDLSASSMHLSALYPDKVMQPISLDPLAATEYLQLSHSVFKCRIRLLPAEETRIFGRIIHTPSVRKNGDYGRKGYDVSKGDRKVVMQIENKLHSLVDEQSTGLPRPPFPLRLNDCRIGVKIREDLRVSWDVYHALPTKSLSGHTRHDILCDMQRHYPLAVLERKQIETHLLKSIDSVTGSGPEVTVFRILKRTHGVASMNVHDMMRIALDSESVLAFNPFFSMDACARIRADVLLWLQLCVLEDKLHRIIQLASKQGSDDLLIQELQARRIWPVEEHPYWLVYEAINAIQIRPTQYHVAKSLMDNEGAIVQLNMGEGKTRVILPMLILYWGSAAAGKEYTQRLHFLRQLLEEGFAFLHGQLSRSVLQVKLFLMPFHRGIKLDVPTVRRMDEHVLSCQLSGGCMVLAREHRQSLHLKTDELMLLSPETSGATVAELHLMKKRKYRDMLDESDELLHYRDELVYAVGEAQPLPGGSSRWAAAEAVLLALKSDATVQSILRSSNLHVRDTAGHEDTSETFPKIRLLVGKELEGVMQPLQLAIAEYVMDNPPYAMCWIRRITATERAKMIQYMCDPAIDNKRQEYVIREDHEDDVLALRGLLSYRILFHCLQQRHSVNYGVNRIDGKKRSAVPFKASGVPSGQSEFAHPDITIVLTMLSYFSDGLFESELKQVFVSLFDLSGVEREAVYNEWLSMSRGSMSVDDFRRIDEAAKVDFNNPCQFTILFRHFRHNMRTIICWLKWCVFPTEGMQYPLKLSANAWHLADNTVVRTRGFSGTDDRKLLLPLQVHSQVVQEEKEGGVLQATNGKMLHLLLAHATYEHLDKDGHMDLDMDQVMDLNAYQSADAHTDAPKKSWKTVIERAQERKCIALIDAGAMMVGASNSEVADYVLETLSLRPAGSLKVKAVLYFNTGLGADCWQIKDTTRRIWPRYASPIHESECFVLFDESRCIGSDVKMPHSATCMLTIGTKACKDKVMQAAGRARMLGRGQTLLLVGMSDVTEKIRITSSLTSSLSVAILHVLEWILENTIIGVKEGQLLWADQGTRHCIAYGDCQYALEDEELSLQSTYGAALTDESPAKVQQEYSEAQLKRREGQPLTKDVQLIFDRIGSQCNDLGQDYTVRKTNTGGERERELAVEVLQIKQMERQFHKLEAVTEKDWTFSTVPRHSLAYILQAMNATTLCDSIAAHIHTRFGLQHIPWPATIYCSTNYTKTVITSGTCGLQDHLRPVGTFLYFPHEKTAVLLSEREADGVLLSLRDEKQTVTNLRFIQLAYCTGKGTGASMSHLTDAQPLSSLTTPLSTPSPSPSPSPSSQRPPPLPESVNFDDTSVDPIVIASLQLFNGDTMYAPKIKKALQEMLATPAAKTAALRLPDIRGLQFMLSRSDLEDVCG